MGKYEIHHGGTIFEPSEYQNEIFNEIECGVDNLIISAAAGSSKTTTIVNSIRYIDEKKSVLFVAFNRDIVKKIKSEVTRESSHISTFHSIGYKFLAENGVISMSGDQSLENDQSIDELKYYNFIKNNINNISSFDHSSLGKKRKAYFNNINKLVDYSRYYLYFKEKDIKKVAEKYGIVPIKDEISVCKKVLEWGKEHTETVDYTDLIWLPNVLNLTTKKYLFDFIFVDEAQDTSIAEEHLIKRCFKRGTRFICVGDNFQQINIWAGSTEEAIDNFKRGTHTKELTLPISYRCPKKIVNLASEYSDNIKAADNAIDGEINYNVSENDAKDGDMVLCRTTAPLIELFLKYLRNNKKCFIRGYENIRSKYVDLIEECDSKMLDKNCITKNGLFPKLYQKLSSSITKAMEYYNFDFDEAIATQDVFTLYDDIEALKVLSEGLSTTEELLNKINDIFQGGEENGIQLSTVHKAKGLEADNVFILRPSLIPCNLAKKDWEIKSERNLYYVAITRAKKTLNFIEEKKHTMSYNSFSINSIKEKLEAFNFQFELNSSSNITEDLLIITDSSTTIDIGSSKSIMTTNDIKKTSKKGGIKFGSLLN